MSTLLYRLRVTGANGHWTLVWKSWGSVVQRVAGQKGQWSEVYF